jgi:hypothetical protein
MRYVMFTYVHPDDAAAYEALPAAEQEAFIERHRDWFRRWREHVDGGEELDDRATVKALRPGRQGDGVVVTDGPYVETKEILGGFVVLTADSLDEAVAMAGEWPSMAEMPGSVIHLQAVLERG